MSALSATFALFDNNLDADGGSWLLSGLARCVRGHADDWRSALAELEAAALGGAW
ncbi:MAG: hypothetical protein HGA47_05770, partial [Zoogloea sp.]|nr:hypothetical protein [Zoogloea sp.]